MNDQISRQAALVEFERWVKETEEMDRAYINGTLNKWIEDKISKEKTRFQQLTDDMVSDEGST